MSGFQIVLVPSLDNIIVQGGAVYLAAKNHSDALAAKYGLPISLEFIKS